jgi:hypothetical protein
VSSGRLAKGAASPAASIVRREIVIGFLLAVVVIAARLVASVRQPSSGKKSAIGRATPVRQRMPAMRHVYVEDF